MTATDRLFDEPEEAPESPESVSKIVRLAWAGSEAVRQRVYRNCLRLASQTPEESREPAIKDYIAGVLSASGEA